MKNTIFLLFFAATLFSCSNKQVYEAVNQNRKTACEKLPIPEQKACIARYDQDYEEYKSHREAVLEEY